MSLSLNFMNWMYFFLYLPPLIIDNTLAFYISFIMSELLLSVRAFGMFPVNQIIHSSIKYYNLFAFSVSWHCVHVFLYASFLQKRDSDNEQLNWIEKKTTCNFYQWPEGNENNSICWNFHVHTFYVLSTVSRWGAKKTIC